MILGKELIEHGIEKDFFDEDIHPCASYERRWSDEWARAGLLPLRDLHVVSRPWLLAGGTEVDPSDVDTSEQPGGASHGDSV